MLYANVKTCLFTPRGSCEVCELLFCSYFMKTTSFIILPLFIISFAKHECKLILNDCIVGFVNEKQEYVYVHVRFELKTILKPFQYCYLFQTIFCINSLLNKNLFG